MSQSGGILVDAAQSIFVPTLAVTATDAEKDGVANGNFHFALSDPNGNPFVTSTAIDVTYTLTGTGIPGTNYDALQSTITIPAGASSIDVPVTAIDDNLIDSTTATITLNSPATPSYAPATDAGAAATSNILDGNLHVTTMSDPSVTVNADGTETLSMTITGGFESDPITFNTPVLTISNPVYLQTPTGETLTATITAGSIGGDAPIVATDSFGNTVTGTATVTTPTPVAPTVSATATANGAHEIDLAINADASTTLMEIDRDGNLIYSGPALQNLPDTGLTPSSTHNYAITALSQYNTSHWSNGVLITGIDGTMESTADASATTDPAVLISATATQPETGSYAIGTPSTTGDLYIAETATGSADINLSAQWTPSADNVSYVVSYDAGGAPTTGTIPSGGSSNVALNAMSQTATGQNMDFTVTFSLVTSGGSSDGSGATCTIHVHLYTVALEFNDTPATNDDAVMLSSPAYGADIPANTPTLDGQLSLVGDAPPNDIPVTLDNPDAQLAFCAADATPTSAPTTQTTTLTLPANGTPAKFKIVGIAASASLFDAKVRVVGNLAGNAAGVVLGFGGVTVFWFQNAEVNVNSGGNYSGTSVRVNANVSNAYLSIDRTVNPTADIANLSAGATIQPAGIDMSIEQISHLRIGIVQDVTSNQAQIVYNNPTPFGPVATGSATVPAEYVTTVTAGGGSTLNDSNSLAPGLYATPDGAPAAPNAIDVRLYSNSLVPPTGKLAMSIDNPEFWFPSSLRVNQIGDAEGNLLGSVSYSLLQMTVQDTFVDYCVICEQSASDPGTYRVIAPLRQTGWSVNATLTPGPNGGFVVNGTALIPNTDHNGGSAPSINPVLSGAIFNIALNNAGAAARAQQSDGETVVQFVLGH